MEISGADAPKTQGTLMQNDSTKTGDTHPRSLWRLVRDDERMTPEHYCATRSDGLSYAVCLRETMGNAKLVREFYQLYGTRYVKRTTPINQLSDDDIQAFLRFVWNTIFLRTPAIRAVEAPPGERAGQ
jgi:hypothetical protein